jgi:hypothetical protein
VGAGIVVSGVAFVKPDTFWDVESNARILTNTKSKDATFKRITLSDVTRRNNEY